MSEFDLSTVTLPDGVRLSGHPGEYVFEKIRTSNTYYEQTMLEAWFLPHARNLHCIYDIGANLGNHSLYFAAHTPDAARIFSFEPMPDSFALLQHNVENNGLQNRFTLFPCALGAWEGTARMSVNIEGNMGSAGISENGTTEVPMRRLDDLQLPAPDFVKIDVEGFELPVLQGMEQTLRNSSPILWVEVDLSTAEETRRFLAGLNYLPADFDLTGSNNILFEKSTVLTTPPLENDIMFCAALQEAELRRNVQKRLHAAYERNSALNERIRELQERKEELLAELSRQNERCRELLAELDRQNTQCRELLAESGALKEDNRALKTQYQNACADNTSLQNELERIRSSRAYRIGRAVVFLPGKVLKLLRRMRRRD